MIIVMALQFIREPVQKHCCQFIDRVIVIPEFRSLIAEHILNILMAFEIAAAHLHHVLSGDHFFFKYIFADCGKRVDRRTEAAAVSGIPEGTLPAL